MALKRTFNEIAPDRTMKRVTMIDGEVVDERTLPHKFVHNGSVSLNLGIKEMKRRGYTNKQIKQYKKQVWDKLNNAVEKKLKGDSKK